MIDIKNRVKDYTVGVTLDRLPANDEQLSGIVSFLDYVREREDVSAVIRINDGRYKDDVPGSVLLSGAPKGFIWSFVIPWMIGGGNTRCFWQMTI